MKGFLISLNQEILTLRRFSLFLVLSFIEQQITSTLHVISIIPSSDARLGVWQRDCHNSEDVLQMVPLSHKNKGFEGLYTGPSPATAAKAKDA